MKTVIVGSGNVATVLGKKIKQAGHEIVQVLSRTLEHAKILGRELDCAYTDDNSAINMDADIYLLALSDSALHGLKELSPLGHKLVLHTAGSVPMDILGKVSSNFGVLYPLQSLRREMSPHEPVPLLVQGNTPANAAIIKSFAESISNTVSVAGDEERLKLHVAAVIVSNFTNHLYTLAEEFCEKEKVDFSMLLPLIRETAQRLDNHLPAAVQTGPAIRNDIFTLDKHLRLLSDHPRLKYIYLKMTDSIMNR
jgi:predicted short-subunit dehydrogenase-like oxidoreductase (DUF2520 family)